MTGATIVPAPTLGDRIYGLLHPDQPRPVWEIAFWLGERESDCGRAIRTLRGFKLIKSEMRVGRLQAGRQATQYLVWRKTA